MFNICCPNCFSKNLFKYGKDPKYNLQKYQCKSCKKQFSERSFIKKKSKYPKCPICGKGTYLHHDYLYYSIFTCNDKKCNHSIKIIKDYVIEKISSDLIKSNQFSFKRMRTNIKLIIDALYMYFVNNSSTRAISNFFKDRYDYYVSHVTIHHWTTKFADVFKQIANTFMPKSLSQSDEWHADETIIKIHGKKYYVWTLIDSETRYIIDYHLTESRDASEAFALFYSAKHKHGSPKSIVSDRLPSYNTPVKSVFYNSKHIKVQKFSDDITNNLIESFFSKFKAHYKAHRGLKSFHSVNKLLTCFFFFYNYIRPHGSLSNKTPARVAGVLYSELSRKNLLLF